MTEEHMMQLTAITVAAMQNTRGDVAERLDRDHPYWSVAYMDVCHAIDREIMWREIVEKHLPKVYEEVTSQLISGVEPLEVEVEAP